jgi:hypothetical protein
MGCELLLQRDFNICTACHRVKAYAVNTASLSSAGKGKFPPLILFFLLSFLYAFLPPFLYSFASAVFASSASLPTIKIYTYPAVFLLSFGCRIILLIHTLGHKGLIDQAQYTHSVANGIADAETGITRCPCKQHHCILCEACQACACECHTKFQVRHRFTPPEVVVADLEELILGGCSSSD